MSDQAKQERWYRSEWALVIFTASLTTALTVVVNRNFISKYEENTFIRELIPTLISSDPRQNDLGLALLQEVVSDSRYQAFKLIVAKRVAQVVDHAIRQQTPSAKATGYPAEISDISLIQKYSELRPEWREAIHRRLIDESEPIGRDRFLSLIEAVDGRTTDKTLRQILSEAAKHINRADYFGAYVGADWVLRAHNDARYLKLVGLAKAAPNQTDAQKILKYFRQAKYSELRAELVAKTVLSSARVSQSQSELEDYLNKDFLARLLQGPAALNPSEMPTPVNKFENVK